MVCETSGGQSSTVWRPSPRRQRGPESRRERSVACSSVRRVHHRLRLRPRRRAGGRERRAAPADAPRAHLATPSTSPLIGRAIRSDRHPAEYAVPRTGDAHAESSSPYSGDSCDATGPDAITSRGGAAAPRTRARGAARPGGPCRLAGRRHVAGRRVVGSGWQVGRSAVSVRAPASGPVRLRRHRPRGGSRDAQCGRCAWREPAGDRSLRTTSGSSSKRQLAYFGTYTVDAARGVLLEHVEQDLVQEQTGRVRDVPYRLDGDRLILGDGGSWQAVLMRAY